MTEWLHVLDAEKRLHKHWLGFSHFSCSWRIADHYRLIGLKFSFQNAGGRVLDFGCGGKPYEKVLRTSQLTDWVGVDLPGVAGKADYFYEGEKLPFKDAAFDLVLATQVFEHVEDCALALKEISRTLTQEGALVVTVPMTSVLHEEPHDYRRFTAYGMQSFAHQAGLKLDQAIALGGVITVVATLIAGHLNFLRRIPFIGRVLHTVLVGVVTQGGLCLEVLFFKMGFRQAKITTDYLFVLHKRMG